MKNIYFVVLLLTVFAMNSCEEKLEEIGDAKGIIGGNTVTYHKTIYANYDSVIQISDSLFNIEANRSTFGQYNGVKMLLLMRFFNFFQDDSLFSIDSAKFRMVNDYTIGDYPVSIPLNFFEFNQTWTTDTLKNWINDNPGADVGDLIFNRTTQQPALQYNYHYDEPDTLENSKAADDTILIDVPTELIEKWYNDPNWEVKGLLLYPEFLDNVMLNFFPFASGGVPQFLISYTRIDENGDKESIVDSSFYLATDITVFSGDFPESFEPETYYLSSGLAQKSFINFDYDTIPDGAVILNGRMVIPVDFQSSLYSVVRPLSGIELKPLIYNQDSTLFQPSFLRTYFIDDFQDDYSNWWLPVTFGGNFASQILQEVYNGIRIRPDSLYVKGFYMQIFGYMDDYSYLKIHSARSPDMDMRPRIEFEYFIPPKSRY